MIKNLFKYIIQNFSEILTINWTKVNKFNDNK